MHGASGAMGRSTLLVYMVASYGCARGDVPVNAPEQSEPSGGCNGWQLICDDGTTTIRGRA
jgi:hypothetical protein